MKYNEIKNYLNGKFVSGMGEKYDVYAPINGEIIGEFKAATRVQLDEVVAEAKAAQESWAGLTAKSRSKIIYKYRELLMKYKEELSVVNCEESGKSIEEAYAGVDKAIELTEFACSIPQLISGKTQDVSRGVNCKEERRPLGVVASITPFNFPVMVPHWTVPNAIALGNAVILKPSELTPISAMKMAELWEEAGLPEGTFNVVNGGKEVVEGICDNKDIVAVSFVGSTPVAQIVHKRGSASSKRVLALGGAKNHIVVMPDANKDAGSRDIISSAFGMSGQRCMAVSVMVGVGNIDNVYEEVITKTKNMVPGVDFPPVISEAAIKKIEDYLDYAQENGAEIVVDGRTVKTDKGYFIGPSIIDWGNSKNMSGEEIFGPVLEIRNANTIAEAAAIQNESPYGNAAAIFTQNGRFVDEAIREFQAGMLGVNIGVPVPREPFSFGGIKASKFGYGDITGVSSIDFWTNLIKITTKWNPEHKADWMS